MEEGGAVLNKHAVECQPLQIISSCFGDVATEGREDERFAPRAPAEEIGNSNGQEVDDGNPCAELHVVAGTEEIKFVEFNDIKKIILNLKRQENTK